MQRGRGEEIAAAHDVGDALQRIVDDDGEMIDRRPVLAREQNVAPSAAARRRRCVAASPSPNSRPGAAAARPRRARVADRAASRGLAAREARSRLLGVTATQRPRCSGRAVGIALAAAGGEICPRVQ